MQQTRNPLRELQCFPRSSIAGFNGSLHGVKGREQGTRGGDGGEDQMGGKGEAMLTNVDYI